MLTLSCLSMCASESPHAVHNTIRKPTLFHLFLEESHLTAQHFKATPSYTSVSGPLPTCFLAISRFFSILSGLYTACAK